MSSAKPFSNPNLRVAECSSLGRSVKLSSMLVLIFIVIAVVLLVAALIYNYSVKAATNDSSDASDKEKHKKAVIGGLTISSAVFAFLATFAAIWQLSVASKSVKLCLVP